MGESATVRGLWLCEAVWVTHGGGMGQQVAEWMVNGEPGYDLAEADANRFYPFQTTPPYVRARGAQQYREVYDILHPLQQMTAPRKLRLTPFYERHAALGAECFTGAGWERPQWFEANRALLTGADWERRDGWAAMNWSPAVGAEHLATRERVGARSTSRRSRSSTWRGRIRCATSSGSAPTGSTGRSARSSTRRCSRRRAGSGATSP